VPHSFASFANEWVIEPSPVAKLVERTIFDLQRPLLKVYPHRTWFSIKVRPKAAPLPMFRLLHQAPLHRIPVHVTQLLDPLAFAPDIEILESFLPDRNRGGVPEPSLRRRSAPACPLHLAGEALFDHLHHDRGVAHFRFRNQQMKMLWHKDVSVHDEAVLVAGLFQKGKENVAAPGRTQMRLTALAAAGYEVQIPGPVVAVQPLRHPITLTHWVGTGL